MVSVDQMVSVQVSDRGVLLVELSAGLSFPAVEHLSSIIHTRALQGEDAPQVTCWSLFLPPECLCVPPVSPPRSVVLDLHHVSVIDYTVVSELRDLLRQFSLRNVQLVCCRVQVGSGPGRNSTLTPT